MKPSVLLFYRKRELETNQNRSKDNGYIQRGIKRGLQKGRDKRDLQITNRQ